MTDHFSSTYWKIEAFLLNTLGNGFVTIMLSEFHWFSNDNFVEIAVDWGDSGGSNALNVVGDGSTILNERRRR